MCRRIARSATYTAPIAAACIVRHAVAPTATIASAPANAPRIAPRRPNASATRAGHDRDEHARRAVGRHHADRAGAVRTHVPPAPARSSRYRRAPGKIAALSLRHRSIPCARSPRSGVAPQSCRGRPARCPMNPPRRHATCAKNADARPPAATDFAPRIPRRSAPSKCRAAALTFARPNTIIRSRKEQMIVFDSADRGCPSQADRDPIATGDTG